MKLLDTLKNTSESAADDNAGIVTLRHPSGPAWDAIEAKCPHATLEETVVLWTTLNLYNELQEWPCYKDVVGFARLGFVVKCPCCEVVSEYKPPLENSREIHDTICGLLAKGYMRCEIVSTEDYEEEELEDEGFQPEIILVVRDAELIDTVLSDFRGEQR